MRTGLTMTLALSAVLVGVVALAQDDMAPPAPARAQEGLIALYRATDVTPEGILPDSSGAADPLDLMVEPGVAAPSVVVRDGGVVFQEPEMTAQVPGCFSIDPAWRVTQAVRASGALTIEAWLTTALPEQSGPARIVSISRDSSERNVTLGQEGTGFIVRLRTAATDLQGSPHLASPDNVVVAGSVQHVVFTFDGALATLFVDGEVMVQSQHFAGDLADWDETMHLVLGNEFDGDRRWYGAIHLVAIYSRELAAGEVRGNYDARF